MKKLSKEAAKLKNAIMKEYDISDDAGISILQTAMEAKDLMHAAQAVVDKQGLTVAGDRGGIKAHPLLSVIRDARAQFLMALKNLNLDLEPLRDKPGRPGGR
jgi:P27 family predicted phage terminase small subunit